MREGSISRLHVANWHSACGYLSLGNNNEAVGVDCMAGTCSKFIPLASIPMRKGKAVSFGKGS